MFAKRNMPFPGAHFGGAGVVGSELVDEALKLVAAVVVDRKVTACFKLINT